MDQMDKENWRLWSLDEIIDENIERSGFGV